MQLNYPSRDITITLPSRHGNCIILLSTPIITTNILYPHLLLNINKIVIKGPQDLNLLHIINQYQPKIFIHTNQKDKIKVLYLNVPPRLRDGGVWERGDAQGGRVGAPPNFGEIHGGWGDIGVPSIGVPVSKIIKKI
jgi:hypothetical protein